MIACRSWMPFRCLHRWKCVGNFVTGDGTVHDVFQCERCERRVSIKRPSDYRCEEILLCDVY